MTLSSLCVDEAKTRTAGWPKSAERLHAECADARCTCPQPHRKDTPDEQ